MKPTAEEIRKAMCRIARDTYKPRIENFDELYMRCESPIERKFIGFASALFHLDVTVVAQEELMSGKYRADFVARHNGRTVMLECDGREYHDFREDRRRDLDVLCHTDVDTVIRLRGCDIQYLQDECATYMQRFAPELFGPTSMKLDGGIILFGVANREDGCKPIIRAKYPLADVLANVKHLEAAKTTIIHGRTPDHAHCVIEFKTNYWDWKIGRMAAHCWSIAEGAIDVYEDWHEQALRDPMAHLAERF